MTTQTREDARSAAVFDLDGTILPGTSAEREFIRFATATGEIGYAEQVARLANWVLHVPTRGVIRNKTHFAGCDVHTISRLGRTFVDTWLMHLFPDEAFDMIRLHRDRGDVVGIVSGAPEDLIAGLAGPLDLDFVVGTELEVRKGRLTGRVARSHNSGATKVERALAVARRFSFDLTRSTAYGDAYTDRFLLSHVSRPVAVNPDSRLRKLAEANGWPVLSYGAGERI